jgi:hypothetical protein
MAQDEGINVPLNLFTDFFWGITDYETMVGVFGIGDR